VVATGMDGASIAAIEPKMERRAMTAPPLMAETNRPAAEEIAAPAYGQPVLASEAADEEQPDLYAAPPLAPVAAEAAPLTRIVDPSVAEEGDAPLFAEPAYEERRPRGGFLSLFGGRPRYDAPSHAPQQAQPRPAPSRGGAQPVEAAAPEEEADAGEDLEIPSFLRRLAN
jgi:cell division protein FtsZ